MSRSTSTSHKRGSHHRGAHGGGGSHGGDGDGDGGGGGGGGGKLVKVAFARNQAEAEMLQGMLSEAGIPSVLKRSGGFDNPDFLAAGPHDVMVNSEAAKRAREVLAETMVETEGEERTELEEQARLERGETGVTTPQRLALWVGIAFAAAVILIWIVYEIA
jgi:Putative prokaryotic signal transducing protein